MLGGLNELGPYGHVNHQGEPITKIYEETQDIIKDSTIWVNKKTFQDISNLGMSDSN